MWLKKLVVEYARRNFNEVYHCTLNPEGPGVVRIFLVPPLVDGAQRAAIDNVDARSGGAGVDSGQSTGSCQVAETEARAGTETGAGVEADAGAGAKTGATADTVAGAATGTGARAAAVAGADVSFDDIAPSVAIINGQDVIPVNVSWSILLIEFIRAVNRYDGRAVSDADVEEIQEATCKAVRKVYPLISKKRLRADIYTIMKTFSQIARGQAVDEPIEYIPLGAYAPFMRAPHRMDLLVSAMKTQGRWNCNQKCVHCFAAGQEQSEEDELATAEWKTIIDRCRSAGVTQLTFTGGEPTMRDDIFELIDYARWFVTRLNTNGIRLSRAYCERLRAVSLDSVQITFYSYDEEIHNALVGANRYAETVAGIENALEAGINMSVNTPLCTLNRDYVKTLAFLHGKGVTYVTCSGLIIAGNATTCASEGMQLGEGELKQVLQDAVAYCHAHGMEISFTSPGWITPGFCNELGLNEPSCGACLSNMAVTPGGHVVPCQSWLSGEVLGDMRHDAWEDIWNGTRCQVIRAASAKMDGTCPLRSRAKGESAEAPNTNVAGASGAGIADAANVETVAPAVSEEVSA